jgi:hypothetical protein
MAILIYFYNYQYVLWTICDTARIEASLRECALRYVQCAVRSAQCSYAG